MELAHEINKKLGKKYGCHYITDGNTAYPSVLENDMERFFALGVEEFLDILYPYQERRIIDGWNKD